jgi:hypothetical protein
MHSPARSGRRISRLHVMIVLACLALLLGGSLWLDRNGTPVTATVGSKREEIAIHDSPLGEWSRWYRLGVEFPRSDGVPGTATLTVSRERFDSLREGDRIAIRYVPAFPLLARSADHSTVQVLRNAGGEVAADRFFAGALTWFILGGAGLWLMARLGTTAVFAAGAVWIAAGLVLLFPAPAPARPGATGTTARVHDIKLITKSPEERFSRTYGGHKVDLGFRELALPYHIVQFRFVVPDWPDSVLAVDVVDSASIAGLAAGAVLPIRYDPHTPRDARLVPGTREFRKRNRYHFGWLVVGSGLLGMVVAALGTRPRGGDRARA